MRQRIRLIPALIAVALSFPGSAAGAADDPALSSRNVRIVDYGADMCGFVYNPYRGKPPYQVRGIEPFMDKDANGTLENDTVAGWQFSLSEPLNFPFAPWYDLRQKSARLYGGVMLYAVNNPERYPSEGCMNANHESRDDFNFMGLGSNKPIPPDELLEAYGLWLWQKADFLNDGDRHAVTFDERSFLAVHISRYWGGFEAGRWVVRDGDQFYVSEKTFDGRDELIDGAAVRDKYDKRNPMTRRTYVLRPSDSRWAVYEPREATASRHSTMDFDAAAATFEPREFHDVTAAGFLATRSLRPATRAVWDNLSVNQTLALKWYAFRCDAVVCRPAQPGYAVPMAPATDGVCLSAGPVSFAQWERIRRIGITNQYCPGLGDLGYSLRSDGAMGGMETDGKAHSPSEPVRRITWIDAVAWCNMLSEYEGLEPAYYADAECTTVLRRAVNRTMRELWGRSPTVHWRTGAEGFRLPTRDELPSGEAFRWEGPAAGAELRVARNAETSDDGEMLSRESDWPDTASVKPDINELTRIAREQAAALTFVRLPIGLAAPEDSNPFDVFIAQRKIDAARNDRFRGLITDEQLEEITRRNRPPDYAARETHDLEVGATEVPYRAWIAVRRWAQRKGYEFNYPGDMGSMRCPADAGQEFSPDEPVTNLCWHDALVWCNALSELTGRRCAYYLDEGLTEPYREAVTFRMDMFDKPGYPILTPQLREAIGRRGGLPRETDTNFGKLIYLDPRADGFRLPYVQEFDKLCSASHLRRRSVLEGQTLAAKGTRARTRAVDAGQTDQHSLYELNGNVLEWAWSPLDSYLGVMGKYRLNGYGCFSMTAEQVRATAKPYEDAVYNARPYFGFRVVRRAE